MEPSKLSSKTAFLLALFLLALFLRVWRLGENGLSEDEANKILAAQHYRQGDFTANGEHPMFLKLLCSAGLIVSEKWNAFAASFPISQEAALRFPVALAGSLMIFALYALGLELFDWRVGLIAATLWAVDINAVALSRIAKEDPLVALFFVLGNFFLLRGKKLHFADRKLANRKYLACGASFGAMFASKYLVPLPWVTLVYYDLFRFKQEPRWRIDRKTLLRLYGCFIAVFLLLNVVVVTPGIVHYGWEHLTQQRLTHHGYYMMGRLYLNTAIQTLWGMPVYFYPLYILVKTPLPLLIFLGLGLVYTLWRFREDHFLFLGLYFVLWTILLSLPGGKFTRYVITLLPAVILLEAMGITLLYTVIRSYCEKRFSSRLIPAVSLAAILGLTAGWQLVLNARYMPNQSFYVSVQTGGQARWGYYFPQDDIYDAGLREAVHYLCKTAPQASTVLGSTPAAFEYYQGVYGRRDLKFVPMASLTEPFPPDPRMYVLCQDYRRYIENNYILDFAYSQLKPLFTGRVKGISTVDVYFFAKDPVFAKAYWTARRWPGLLSGLTERKSPSDSKIPMNEL